MARNRSSRRTTGIKNRVSPTASRVTRSRDSGPRVGRDGKAKVACPGCGAEYMVPAAALDNEVVCKHCHTAFVPRFAGKQAAAEKFNGTPYYIGGGILAVVIGIYLAMSGNEPVKAKEPEAPKEVVLTGLNNARVRAARDWGKAVSDGDSFNITKNSDIAALQARFSITEVGDAGAEALVEKLKTDESTNWFREWEISSAALEDPDQHKANTGRVILFLNPRAEWIGRESGKPYWWSQYGKLQIAVSYRMVSDQAKITAFTPIGKIPKPRKKGKPAHKAHKEIGEAKVVKRKFGNETIEVLEANIVKLKHMDGLSEAEKKEIDTEIAALMNISDNRLSNRAVFRLGQIGKAAIPMLLNQMYETKMDSQDNILRLRLVCAALEDITGQRFGFNPSVTDRSDGVSNDEARLSALRQWYGYWTTHHDREDWDIAIDKEENLDFPGKKPPEKKGSDKKN